MLTFSFNLETIIKQTEIKFEKLREIKDQKELKLSFFLLIYSISWELSFNVKGKQGDCGK